MSQQITKRMIDRVKFQVLSRDKEEFNMKGSLNMRLKIKITYNKKSYTFDFHDSIRNLSEGTETSKDQILDIMCDNYMYHTFTVMEIQNEFGSDVMSMCTCEAIKKEADSLARLFSEDEISKLKASCNGEDFTTETDDKAKESFNDDDPIWSNKELKDLGLDKLGFTDKVSENEYNIALTPKRIKENMFLLGETKDGDRVWLSRGSWECGWYYGFGYISEYANGSWSSSYHFDKFEDNKNMREGMLEYFRDGKLVVTSKQSWVLCDLMKSFYTLKEAYEVYHSGGSHLASVEQLDLSHSLIAKQILKDIRRVIIEAQRILSPSDEDAERITND